MTQDQRDLELEKLIKDIQRILTDQMRANLDTMRDGFKYVSEMGRRDAYRLALLRFGNTTLEAVWIKALEDTTKQWDENSANTLNPYDRYEIEHARRYLAKHPSSSLRKDGIDGLFAQIRFVSGQEHADYLKTVFDRHAEKELRMIDESEEEI